MARRSCVLICVALAAVTAGCAVYSEQNYGPQAMGEWEDGARTPTPSIAAFQSSTISPVPNQTPKGPRRAQIMV